MLILKYLHMYVKCKDNVRFYLFYKLLPLGIICQALQKLFGLSAKVSNQFFFSRKIQDRNTFDRSSVKYIILQWLRFFSIDFVFVYICRRVLHTMCLFHSEKSIKTWLERKKCAKCRSAHSGMKLRKT
jgi:hypothetical protein